MADPIHPNASSPQPAPELAGLAHGPLASVPSGGYSNRHLSPPLRFAHWREHMTGVYDCEPTEPEADHLVESHHWVVDGMLVVSGRYPAVRIARGESRIRADALDHYALTLRPPGTLQVDASEDRIATPAMQPLLVDMARPFEVNWDAGPGITLYLPRAELDELLPRALDLHGAKPDGIGAKLLAQHLLALERHLPAMPVAAAPGTRSATLHLVAASLARNFESLGLARPAVEDSLQRMVRSEIEAQLQNMELGAEMLCERFHISRSTLYRLFDADGGVATYIRDRRLAHIHALLAQPGRRQYIGRIAQDYGFQSPANFSRVFHAHFGYRPREVPRNAAATGGRREQEREASLEDGFRPWLDAWVRPGAAPSGSGGTR